jgi:hypothetical protein
MHNGRPFDRMPVRQSPAIAIHLVLVARSLSGRDFGDGDVYRACAAACATAAKVAVRSHEVILITTHGTMS